MDDHRYPAVEGASVPLRKVPDDFTCVQLGLDTWHADEGETPIRATVANVAGTGHMILTFHGGHGEGTDIPRVYALDVRDLVDGAYRADRRARGLPEEG